MAFYIWTGTIDSGILSSPETSSSQILRKNCIYIWQYSFPKEHSCFKINTVAIRVLLKISNELITWLNLSRCCWTILQQGWNSACELSPKPCCAFAVHTPESGFKEREISSCPRPEKKSQCFVGRKPGEANSKKHLQIQSTHFAFPGRPRAAKASGADFNFLASLIWEILSVSPCMQ